MSSDEVVIPWNRALYRRAIAVALVFLAIAVFAAVGGGIRGSVWLAWLCVAVTAVGVLLGAVPLVRRRPQVTASTEGIRVATHFGSHSHAWSDVRELKCRARFPSIPLPGEFLVRWFERPLGESPHRLDIRTTRRTYLIVKPSRDADLAALRAALATMRRNAGAK